MSEVLTETEEDRRDLGRRMWRKGWGRVSGGGIDRNRGGQKRPWEKDVEERMEESAWGVG